jgi:hypothetical protein
MRVSPLPEVYTVLHSLPRNLTSCELIRSDHLTMVHNNDVLAQEESFFAHNAMAAGSSTTYCDSTAITPLSSATPHRQAVSFPQRACIAWTPQQRRVWWSGLLKWKCSLSIPSLVIAAHLPLQQRLFASLNRLLLGESIPWTRRRKGEYGDKRASESSTCV